MRGANYDPADVARLRALAEQHDYSWKSLVALLPNQQAKISNLSRYGKLTPDGVTLKRAFIRRRAERVIEAMRAHNNDWDATSKALYVTPSTLRYYLHAAGMLADDFAPLLAGRPCIQCGKLFHSANSTKKTCSRECLKQRIKTTQLRAWRKRNGQDPYAPKRLEAAREKYVNAMIQYFGRTKIIAEKLGVGTRTVDNWIHDNNMREFQERCRARERDPEFLQQVLEENDWDFGRAGKAISRSARFVRDCLRDAGRHDIVDNAPCKVCGKPVPRMGKRRPMCSAECRRIQHAENARARYHKNKEQTCINRSQSQDG